MNNKIGIFDNEKIKEIEYYLFNIKYHLINENYTFNQTDMFNVNYLEQIHIFLFSDIYDIESCKVRKDFEEELKKNTNESLLKIKEMLYTGNTSNLKNEIYSIWLNQIFYDGNTRTLLCYLKILSKVFDFKITYDFTKDVDKDYFINEVIDSIIEEHEKNR